MTEEHKGFGLAPLAVECDCHRFYKGNGLSELMVKAPGEYQVVVYPLARQACCEAQLYLETNGHRSAVFKFCDKHGDAK